MTVTAVSYGIVWILILFICGVSVVLLQQLLAIKERLALGATNIGLRPGATAPAFSGKDLSSGTRLTFTAEDRALTVLLFLSPECHTCMALAESISRQRPGVNTVMASTIVCQGDEQACQRLVKTTRGTVPIVVDSAHHIKDVYRTTIVPTMVLIDGQGVILSYRYPRDEAEMWQLISAEHNTRATPAPLVAAVGAQ